MKKTLFVLLFITVASNFALAQGFRLGAKAGINANKMSGTTFQSGFAQSFHLGAFAEIDINKFIGVQPEVIWNQSATKATNVSNIAGIGISDLQGTKLDYLSIPILLRVNLGGMFSVLAGPQYSILISKDKTFLANGQNAFKSGDLAAVLGAQVNLKTFRIYGRYNIGLNNINDVVGSSDKWTSQQIQAGLGIRL